MKKFILLITVFYFSVATVFSQGVNGVIVSDTSNFKIIKVWGTHQERGYALGYLDGDRVINLLEGYIKPALGSYYAVLRGYLESGSKFIIDSNYDIEAQGMADGIIAAGFANADEIDKIDVLACNTFFDFLGYLNYKDINIGCSSLMSWGDATTSTDLDGKSVISRHLDWNPSPYLKNSNVVVAHIPDEENEQAWITIGFSGQMSALSGVNSSGLALFQHSLDDFSGYADQSTLYEPIWFTTRKVLESIDYNGDNQNDVNDLRSAMIENTSGYSNGVIISALAPASLSYDTLIALVAESACTEPYHSFRTNTYDDLIPGDNLYAANGSVIRNNANNYEPRYMNVVNNIGDGTMISSEANWGIMAEYSNLGYSNLQFIQFIPEDRILNVSVSDANNYAYEKEPVSMLIDSLFTIPSTGVSNINEQSSFRIFPNPSHGNISIELASDINKTVSVSVYSCTGKVVREMTYINNNQTFNIDLNEYQGVYIIELKTQNNIYRKKIVIKK